MPMQYTLAMIKPDVNRKISVVREIIRIYRGAGLKISHQKVLSPMPINQASELYREHQGRSYYEELIDFITQEIAITLMIYGENAIEVVRTLNGATKPEDWMEGTIRRRYGTDMMHNAVHGSANALDAARELAIFFPPEAITNLPW